jgi:hypothetical protein
VPFLRFSKDRRGYESTFLLRAQRAGERDAPVLLYWFRTPPHVKMGRGALDEETIRALEDTHPSVDFDWPRILASRPPSEPPPEPNRPPRPRRRGERGEERGTSRPSRPATPVRDVPTTGARAVAEPVETDPEPQDLELRSGGAATPADAGVPEIPVPDSSVEPAEPASPVRKFTRIFDAPADFGAGEAPVSVPSPPEIGRLSEPSAADRALGSEQLERLRGRYAAVMARIARRITDPALADRLRATAERANPDNWVTDEEVKTGLAGLGDVYNQLVPHIGRRRRRRRSGGRPRPDSPTMTDPSTLESAASDPESLESDVEDTEDAEDDDREDEDPPESDG